MRTTCPTRQWNWRWPDDDAFSYQHPRPLQRRLHLSVGQLSLRLKHWLKMPVEGETLAWESPQYSGDANYAAGTATPTPFTVVKASPIFEGLGVGNTGGGQVVAGQSATATATIYGSSKGVPPTGTVIFNVNNIAVSGTATYSSVNSPPTLTATIPTVFSTPGSYPIGASYSGDANYAAATYPVPYSLVVLGPISIAPIRGIPLASPGLSGSTTLSVTPNGGFSGTATVACTPDPNANEATCSLVSGSSSGSTLQVSVSGSGATLTLNVTTTAPHQLARQDTPSFGVSSKLALAGMLVLFLPAFRRRRKYFVCLIAMVLTLSLAACGGGGSGGGGGGGKTDAGTALGTYSFTVTATTGSGASLYSTTAPLSVTVN